MTPVAPTQSTIWKNMSLGEKYQLFAATVRQTREFTRIGIRLRRPEASPEEVEKELARIWLHARPLTHPLDHTQIPQSPISNLFSLHGPTPLHHRWLRR
jgi:hypothetical protein